MDGRLEGRARQAQAQSLRLPKESRQLPNQDEPSRRKKRTPGGTAAQLARAWLGPTPHRNYARAVDNFCAVIGPAQPRQIRQEQINALLAAWHAKYSRATLHTFVCLLRRLTKHLQTKGAPALEVPKVKGPRARPNVATDEQLHQLVHAAPPWLRLFILLCWQTALRFSEAYRVTPRSYDAKTKTAAITTKGGKHRVIPLTQQIVTLIEPTLEGDPDKSCIALLKGGRCSPETIRYNWHNLTKSLGISELNPHDLRRTTATNLYRASKDLRAVQTFLGHDAMTSTLHYLAPLKEEELRQYHRLLNFESEVKQ